MSSSNDPSAESTVAMRALAGFWVGAVAAALASLMIGSLVVRVGAQVRRKQREILSALHQQRGAIEALARRIEAIEAAGVPQNGKVIELGTRIASKIVHD